MIFNSTLSLGKNMRKADIFRIQINAYDSGFSSSNIMIQYLRSAGYQTCQTVACELFSFNSGLLPLRWAFPSLLTTQQQLLFEGRLDA